MTGKRFENGSNGLTIVNIYVDLLASVKKKDKKSERLNAKPKGLISDFRQPLRP
jgi:hypothetical protein